MRRALAGLVLALTLLGAGPARAYDDGGNGYRSDRDCRDGGGCDNRRREDYSGAGCKYVCPKFDKSPVQDSFNIDPTICLPGSTCNVGDDKKKNGQPPPQEERASLACMVPLPFHCDRRPQ